MAAPINLTVVIIPLVGQEALARCLDRLPLDAVECIVLLRETAPDPSFWTRRYPSVNFLQAIAQPVPMRRQRGVVLASGDVVALLEDTSWPEHDWCAAVRSAFADARTLAAGGPVRIPTTLPSRYEALGWCEYGAFAASSVQRRGVPLLASRVPGNNMAFRRSELIKMVPEGSGLFEGPVCERILIQGRQIVFEPRMLVTYAACDHHNASPATRLHHGRIYAAAHVENRNWFRRSAHIFKALLLPLVLTSRTIGAAINSRRQATRPTVLVWIALMQSAWALGEAIGALFGPGKSMNEWR